VSLAADLLAVQRRIDAIAGPAVPLGALEFERLVRREAAAAGVDPSLVAAVARTESGLDPRATSPAGAAGLMQLMPATAQALGVADPYDPVANVRGGAIYLKELLARFGGDVALAVAAYNAGPGAVERFGGVPPYTETRRYVARVLEAYRAEVAR
jgi:soluble lytic murein transglycosylase-like protein